jgi:TPR repeat protein
MKKHLIQAAEKGNAEAQFNLSVMYENELTDNRYVVEGSRPDALKWLLAAAEQGLPRAQIKLAEMYAAEPDVPENSVRACAWLLRAAAGLHGVHLQKVQSAYEKAALRLTADQIVEARQFAEGWRPRRTSAPVRPAPQEIARGGGA